MFRNCFIKGLEWVSQNVELIEYKIRNSVKKEKRKLILPKIPIGFSSLKYRKTFRLVPTYKNIAVSEDGVVLNIYTNLIMKPRTSSTVEYLLLSLYDCYLDKYVTVLVHRLVALAWVENDNYEEKPIVDHKDGNKLNNHYTNLEWVSYSKNNARASNNQKENMYLVKRVSTGKIFKAYTINDVRRIVGAPNLSRSKNEMPFIYNNPITGYWVVEDTENFQNWKIEEEIINKEKPYLVIDEKGYEYRFKKLKDIIKFFRLAMPYSISIENVKRTLRQKGLELKVFKTDFNKKYDILNVKINEEFKNLTSNEAINKINVGLSNFYRRISNEKFKGKLINNEWLVKLSSEKEYPKIQRVDNAKQKLKLINTETNKEIITKSIREASRIIGVDKRTITRYIGKEEDIKKYRISYVN